MYSPNAYFKEKSITDSLINSFIDRNRAKYGDFAYSTGFLSSTLVEALMLLPKEKRDNILSRFA